MLVDERFTQSGRHNAYCADLRSDGQQDVIRASPRSLTLRVLRWLYVCHALEPKIYRGG